MDFVYCAAGPPATTAVVPFPRLSRGPIVPRTEEPFAAGRVTGVAVLWRFSGLKIPDAVEDVASQ